MATKVHLRGLNGIRAIASLAVVISHIALNFENFGFSPSHGLDLAGFGVSMFFSLSGFLITYLLMIEKSDFGDVSIKDFYIRRILRIWPLYFFYLIVCILVIILTQPQELRGNITYYILLSGNMPFILGSSPH
ncbi:MAG: acyltransferase [Chitinophagaceae bacterium]|nr:acyltransferase [Chitinophagaceae bacterium]